MIKPECEEDRNALALALITLHYVASYSHELSIYEAAQGAYAKLRKQIGKGTFRPLPKQIKVEVLKIRTK